MTVFLKEFFENVDVEKISKRQQKHEKLPSMQKVKLVNELLNNILICYSVSGFNTHCRGSSRPSFKLKQKDSCQYGNKVRFGSFILCTLANCACILSPAVFFPK